MQGTVFIFTELLHCIIIICKSTMLCSGSQFLSYNNCLIGINDTSNICHNGKGRMVSDVEGYTLHYK